MVGVDLSFFVFFYYALVHVLKFHNLTFVFQIHSFQSLLQTMPVSTAEEAKVTSIFLTLFFQNTCANQRQHSCVQPFQSFSKLSSFLSHLFQVLLFLLDLQGEPKGLSIGGLLVITKSTSLAVS